jgi:translation initiation factor IF-3
LKVNREIRAPRVRVIGPLGEQIGILPLYEALEKAEEAGLDLVEIVPGSSPPVCKIINFGKFRYDQTKREKENKKAQHQVKVKEIKVKPNIDPHDLETKMKHARRFLQEGDKVKIICTFKGREVVRPERGRQHIDRMVELLEDIATVEVPPKMFGKMLSVVLAPGGKKKKDASGKHEGAPKAEGSDRASDMVAPMPQSKVANVQPVEPKADVPLS